MKLADIDTADTDGMSRKEAEKEFHKLALRLHDLQDVFDSDPKRRMLLVFQAMDTGGKDGVIRQVAGAFNPRGLAVASFKKPTAEEASQHFLWRINKALPKTPGTIAVFNRSHYEDILVPTVFATLPKAAIEKRYAEINAWEKDLADESWTILKFYLHISKDEQKERLQARLDDPKKNWKFDPADLKMRKLWPKFMRAYEDIINRTNTKHAPWHVIPADHKWYRDYAVAKIVKKALKKMDLRYPDPPPGLKDVVIV